MEKFGTERWALKKIFDSILSPPEFKDCHRTAGDFIRKLILNSDNLKENIKIKLFKTSEDGLIAHSAVLINNKELGIHSIERNNLLDQYYSYLEIDMNNIVKLGYATRELNSQNFSRSFKIMEEIFDDFILSTQTNTKEFGFDKRLYKSFLDRCLENNLIAKTREEKNHYYFKITDEGIKSYLDYLCLKSSATSISHEKIQQVVDILSERVAPVSNDGFGSFNSQEWTSESETGRFLEVSNLDFFNLNYSDLKNEISKNLSPSYERERFNLG